MVLKRRSGPHVATSVLSEVRTEKGRAIVVGIIAVTDDLGKSGPTASWGRCHVGLGRGRGCM